MVAAATTVSVEMIRAREESKRWGPLRKPPTRNAMPSTSTLFARIEPTSAACTTFTRPSWSAKSAMKSSGRLPRADWMTLAPPEPSRAPICSVAVPTSRARAARAAAATKNVRTGPAPAKCSAPVIATATAVIRSSIRSRFVTTREATTDRGSPSPVPGIASYLERGKLFREVRADTSSGPFFQSVGGIVLRHVLLVLALVVSASVFASTASASELIDRNAQGVEARDQREG